MVISFIMLQTSPRLEVQLEINLNLSMRNIELIE